jgi:hypothetical protein
LTQRIYAAVGANVAAAGSNATLSATGSANLDRHDVGLTVHRDANLSGAGHYADNLCAGIVGVE